MLFRVPIKMTCGICGCMFEAGRPGTMFCKDCRAEAKRRREKKRREEKAKLRPPKEKKVKSQGKRAFICQCPPSGEKIIVANAGEMEYCPRMHVRMVNLPCGQRPECWGGNNCERAKSKGVKRFFNNGVGRFLF